MDDFTYDSPTQDLRIAIREADYQPEHARRLALQVFEPRVIYPAIVRIQRGHRSVGGGQITPDLGEVERAVEMYLAQDN